MKIDCAPTGQASIESERLWQRVFAWFPVRVSDHDCRWLEYVERREARLMSTDPRTGITLWSHGGDPEYRAVQP